MERAVAAARRAARSVAWERAGERAPNHAISAANPLVVDIDATIVVAPVSYTHLDVYKRQGLGDFDVAAIAGGHIDIARVDPHP